MNKKLAVCPASISPLAAALVPARALSYVRVRETI
jgi:hypothetical protein